MVTLTVEEESVCKKLIQEGFPDLADFMRERYVREHEVFDELKHVDVDTLYSPAVPEAMRGAMRRAIAANDRAVVSSLHSLCLTLEETAEPSLAVTDPYFPFHTAMAAYGFMGLLAAAVLGAVVAVVFGL